MATLRSNLNSVSTALKTRITTCLKHWRQQNVQQQQQQQQHQRDNYRRLYHEFHLRDFTDKTSENFKNFNKKLRNFFRYSKTSRKTYQRGEKVIVAKLLSSTLIATTIRTITTSTESEICSATLEEHTDARMTITDDTITQIRDEHPDLDAEVRSILISRAQDGATISDIRDDYRKNVGMPFPIYDNITEYLLTIPSVSALCNERGTRIFSIMPTDKTKHLYDMVQQQKPPQSSRRPTYPNGGRRRVHPYTISSRSSATHSWRSRSNNPQQDYNNNNNNENQLDYYHNNNYGFAGSVNDLPQQHHSQQQQFVIAPVVEKSFSQSDGSDGFVDNNYYYQDNCNYLYSRLYNQQQNNLPSFVMEQNFNNDILKNLNENIGQTTTSSLRQPLQSLNKIHNNFSNNINANNRPKPMNNFKPILSGPRHAITSSPSGTRSSRTNESLYTTDSDYEAHLLDFPLLGDDFFLYLARMELKCKFKKFQKILQSGLCVSGQTISAAVKRVQQLGDVDKHIIVNIGSVDILQGRPLVQIEHDFRTLITTMSKRGITPILTTLAPLANYSHEAQIKQKLERFNQFIKREGNYLRVIDIYSCLVNERKQTLFDCYQNAPRSVTGAPEPYVFWNKIGRQRVLQLIESKIEY